ncbi:unnamed protein product [Leptosia nina]|uniref:Uncharacterized protein n=1 Tax=Leptosia nina TaxID=320188 RepID=A0AAV1JW83_9NEOP
MAVRLCVQFILAVVSIDAFSGQINTTYDNSLDVTNQNIARSKSIFETFLKQLVDILIADFAEKKLRRYCRILYEQLRYSEYRYGRKFAKHFKHLSRMYHDELLEELEFYRRELDKSMQHRTEFFEAINEAFTLQQEILFADYLYDLRDYGKEDKLFIHEETRKLIKNVIIESILKLSAKSQNDIATKLRRALKEFKA